MVHGFDQGKFIMSFLKGKISRVELKVALHSLLHMKHFLLFIGLKVYCWHNFQNNVL